MKLYVCVLAFITLVYSQAVAAGSNLVPNAQFAKSTDGWGCYGGQISWSPSDGHAAKGCVLVSKRTDMGHGLTLSTKGKLTPGVVYKYTAWVKPKANQASYINISLYTRDSEGQRWVNTGNQMIQPGQWNAIWGYLETPAPRGELQDQIMTIGGATVGMEYYVDDVSITRADSYTEQLTVDCTKAIGKATARGIGFLFGVTATEPDSTLFEALNPKLVRHRAMTNGGAPWGKDTGFPSEPFMKRIAQAGAKSQIVLSDEYCWAYGYHAQWGWPGDAAHDGLQPFDLLDRTIETVYRQSVEKGYQIEWDIWNEPDYKDFWGRDMQQYLDTWKHAYAKIRSLDPKATIVGPSNAYFTQDGVPGVFIKQFLTFCKQNNCLPDVLSWHEMDNFRDLPRQIQLVKAFMKASKIKPIPIDINEYIGEDFTRRPGVYPWFYGVMEAEDIRYAAHACWKDADDKLTMLDGRLDGLVTAPPYKPLAQWHVTKAYSQMQGELLTVKNGDAVGGLACRNRGDMVTVLLGNSSITPQRTVLSFKGLRQQGSAVLVIQRIPDTGWVSTPQPAREQSDVMVKNGKLTLPLKLAPYEAVSVRVVTLTK